MKAPSEIYRGQVDEIEGLDVWRDMFSKELTHWFRGYADALEMLKGTVRSLDRGKRYVMEGHDWLCAELFGAACDPPA